MKRRDFITLIGGAAAWPLAVRAQEPTPIIGYLDPETPALGANRLRAFREGLDAAGYAQGKNVALEFQWAEGQNERLPELAAGLVRRQVSVIAAFANAATVAKAATSTIPIVFATASDPVQSGLVASLNRPGSNITGATSLNTGLGPKRVELLHEMIPAAKTIGALVNPDSFNAEAVASELRAAARTLGLEVQILSARSESEIAAAFETLARVRIAALVIGANVIFSSRSERIAALAVRHAMPTIFYTREFAVAGGLMSYGGSNDDAQRLAGAYAGRILKGEKPADLPVQQEVRVELVINLKAAKAFGLTPPLSLLGRADEVIE